MAEERNNGNAKAINLESFKNRLKKLYKHWNDYKADLWGDSDVLAIATPPLSEDFRYLKSSALNIWLFGYEFPDTIMVFMKKEIHFLCSQKRSSFLESVKKATKDSVGAEVIMHVKSKTDDGTKLMDAIFSTVHTPIVGYIARELPEGNLLQLWTRKLNSSNFQLNDISNGFSDLFAVKDSVEITNVKKAAYLTSSVMKHFVVPSIEKIIDEEKKVSHSSLMDDTEKVILEPSKINVKLKAENIDICYPPIFQSGGEFDLKPSALSNDDNLYYDSTSVIICAIGSRYNNYCSNVARTYLFDANPMQVKAYEVLLKAQEASIAAMKPGNKASVVFQAAMSIVEKDGPEFLPYLTKSVGIGMGIQFRESGLSLNAKNDRVLKPGMVFNVSHGLHNLETETENSKTKKFSLLLADTVIVSDDSSQVMTSLCSKSLKDVSYSFNEEEQPKVNVSKSSNATLRSVNNKTSKEELRRQHQTELVHQKNEETARRLAGAVSSLGNIRGSNRPSTELVSYKNVNDIPPLKNSMIQIDQKNEAILLPIQGMVPFHIANVKSVSSQQESHHDCSIRIIFNVPGIPFSPHNANTNKFQSNIYVKEASFRCKDPRHLSEVVQKIKTLRKQATSRELEKAKRAMLVSQEKLQLSGAKFKPIRLSGLFIRPVFGGRGRKLSGTLDAHANGFRYSTSRSDELVDIMYVNVKHAFFQPAEKEMITLLHFHLHNDIMVGNKRTKDVQFFVKVIEDVTMTSGSSKRSAYDPDEIEEEERERDRKNKINIDFQNFVNRTYNEQPQFKGLDLEFDQAFRDLGFNGSCHNSSVFMVPTSSCLVELIETPFVVISLNEIEIVSLERVGPGYKNFDMKIVFKDFKRDVFCINSIPSSSLEGIKEWLDTTDLKYYETKLNLLWRPILNTIMEDPEKFIEDGGWEFLNMEDSDSDSDKSEESDHEYKPLDGQSDQSSTESEEDEEDDSEESLVESEEESDEEEDKAGKTWEELEKEASKADREEGVKEESDSEEEERKRRKRIRSNTNINHHRGMTKRPKFR